MILQSSLRPVSDTTAVITLTGSLTLGTSLKTADTNILNAIEGGMCRLVLDMSGVPYMDSAGLGALVHAAGLAQERGGRVRLSGVTDRVTYMLRMTKADSLLPADPDVETALRALDS